MSRSFASGKRALGTCDRCGRTYKLRQLRNETINLNKSNFLVCPKCFDPDHDQNRQGRIDYSDPQALRNPSPDNSTGRELPAAYRWDFSTGVALTVPTRFDGWLAANGTIAYDSINKRISVTNDPDSNDPGDPWVQRGWVQANVAPDYLSIDTTKYSIVNAVFIVNRFPPTAATYAADPVHKFQGGLFWSRDTGVTFPIDYPFSAEESENARPLGDFGYSQASGGFAASEQEMATRFKITWDLGSHAFWTGTVTSIRLDLFHDSLGVDAGDIEYEYIEVVSYIDPE